MMPPGTKRINNTFLPPGAKWYIDEIMTPGTKRINKTFLPPGAKRAIDM